MSVIAASGCSDDGGSGNSTPTSCADHFDCTRDEPYCRVTSGKGVCLPALDECTGDDTGEIDDGPAAATTISLGQSRDGKTCTGSGLERDWYRIELASPGALEVVVAWSDTDANFNPKFYDGDGAKLNAADGSQDLTGPAPFNSETYEDLAAGSYYIEIDPNTFGIGEPAGKVAVAYTLTLQAP
jgi:hypothetical protein